MQKNNDYDLFAIINSAQSKHKSFFQDQNIVKFKKIWFLHDYLSKSNKNIDLEYLKNIEKKYSINLWISALGDNIFHTNFNKFKDEEILSLLEQDCKLFEKVLDEINPDFLCIKITDRHHNQLLYEICKARGIKILMLTPARFSHKWYISEEIDKMDKMNISSYEQSNDIRTEKEIQEYLKSNDPSNKEIEFQKEIKRTTFDEIKSIFNFGRTIPRIIIGKSLFTFKKYKRESFMEKNLPKSLSDNHPFIYFPLHVEPERALYYTAPFYTNQLDVIFNISQSMPIGYKLFVKDHPGQRYYNWRDISFYKKIMSYPNVTLLHPSIIPKEIMGKCSLVITIGGTAGLEAGFYKKPTILFADLGYAVLPHVTKLERIEDLPKIIRTSLDKKIDTIALDNYINLIEKNSFKFNMDSFITGLSNRVYSGFYNTNVNISTNILKSFLQDYSSIFELIANEHIKKINQFKENTKK
jgi:hypothetical protein